MEFVISTIVGAVLTLVMVSACALAAMLLIGGIFPQFSFTDWGSMALVVYVWLNLLSWNSRS